MTINRRNFIKSGVTSGAALMLAAEGASATTFTKKIPATFAIKIMATNWGFDGTIGEFCLKAKQAGYDGIEVVFPGDAKSRQELLDAAKQNNLSYAFLVGTGESDFAVHIKNFEKNLRAALDVQPMYINCHAGKDYFSFDQNKSFMDLTGKLHQDSKIPIYHETHRSRILYSAPVARTYIEKVKDLHLTLDISHWCAVHESLLADQAETIDLALERTDHIHARIGHPEGPQVNDPRAPEWKNAFDAHLNWWDKVLDHKISKGASMLTILTEFGPVDYMPALPYTRQPVANQWEINVYMMQLLRKRYIK